MSEDTNIIRKKCDVLLQTWERQRRKYNDNCNPQQEEETNNSLFNDIVTSSKQLSIDVNLRKEESLFQIQIIETLNLLSILYPEVKKAKKLASIIMGSFNTNFIPYEIKIPVLSSLGIKAVIQIGKIDHTPFIPEESDHLFQSFVDDYIFIGNRDSDKNPFGNPIL